MWDRKQLKENAKILLKQNYWKSVLTGLILTVILGGFAFSAGNGVNSQNDVISENIGDASTLIMIVMAFLVAFIILIVIGMIVMAFAYNPLELGCKKYFIEVKYGKPSLGMIGWGFYNGYIHICGIMFARTLFITLWSFLFIIPGIVKSYEYMMVPYIVADNPSISRKEAFRISKNMMMGNKWGAFKIDLSFIGWDFLSAITAGLAGIFYVFPYKYLVEAELYHALKE